MTHGGPAIFVQRIANGPTPPAIVAVAVTGVISAAVTSGPALTVGDVTKPPPGGATISTFMRSSENCPPTSAISRNSTTVVAPTATAGATKRGVRLKTAGSPSFGSGKSATNGPATCSQKSDGIAPAGCVV